MKTNSLHIVSILSLALLCLLAFGSSSDDSTNKDHVKISAYTMSQQYVKDQLKAPSTAKFPWYEDAFVFDLGGGKFQVNAYVDAENSFGAKLRSHYTCKLQKIEDGDYWILEEINID